MNLVKKGINLIQVLFQIGLINFMGILIIQLRFLIVDWVKDFYLITVDQKMN